jgi:quinol-cytochrome oxidoreductase complex cytochrome b subunit
VLKWDQEGFEALGHNLEIGKLLGGVGFWFSPTFAGDVPILIRLYAAHVVFIPGLIVVLVALHMLLVKKHKVSPHPALPSEAPGDQAPAAEPTEPFTHHLRRISSFGLALFGLIGVLAVVFPPGLGAHPVEGIEVTTPPLNFWWLYTLENFFGLPAIIYGELVFFGLLAIVPFVDRGPERYWRRRPVAMSLLALFLVALVVLTVMLKFMAAKNHLGMGG